MIQKLADDNIRYHLALSLHAADNDKRSTIIPLNKKYPIEDLIESLKYFHARTKKRLTIEYLLFNGFNDTLADAANLARFCRNFPVKINLIEYNPIAGSIYKKPDQVKVNAFKDFLERKNMVVNVRRSRGGDINAACGQLAGKEKGRSDSVQV
jgi:23S rRNA (adenine2503-C2)-methyltransferase